MTRRSRAIRFPRASQISFIFSPALALLLGAGQAFASPDTQRSLLNADLFADTAGDFGIAPDRSATLGVSGTSHVALRSEPKVVRPTAPSVETPLHHFYCVEYARLRSGLQLFGDARTWWQRAQNMYAEFTQPTADAVMVFERSKRIARGHVAVVAQVVSPREIRVDQANWQNRGEVDRSTPVLDVSSRNDWSRVRVWDMRSGQFGSHIYAIKGFIARALVAAAGT